MMHRNDSEIRDILESHCWLCPHWGYGAQGREGCKLHTECAARIYDHVRRGGSCLAEPPRFAPLYNENFGTADTVG